MSYIKFAFLIAAVALVSAPSIADAQSFTQRGTRGGAIAGALIGGVIGDQNNNAFTGAVIGGLVGGAAGRAVGKAKDAKYYGGNQYYGPSRQSYYGGGGYSKKVAVQRVPVSRGYGGGYGRGYGGGGCPYGGRGY